MASGLRSPRADRAGRPDSTGRCVNVVRAGVALCSLAAALFVAAPAHAYDAGDWLLRVGATQVRPKSNTGNALDGAVGLHADKSVRPSFTVTYMATQNIGIELLGAVPFQHDVSGSGAVSGNIVDTKQLPPTLSLQWHFLPDSKIQPYVGVGLNYTHFFDTKGRGALAGNNVKLTDSWGVAGQVGVDYQLSDRWLLNADVRYIDIDSKVKLNGDTIGHAHVDPWVFTVAVGYRF
ncbi:hypothetical protein CEY04_20245 [Achromobacter sp. HZ28]|nr:hypothetical protein CEY04_20245 [Achromobacter sp. HZ28]OWT76769.1 hypothetical protein CEY05_15700 [Achromobacter sp. HZ34]